MHDKVKAFHEASQGIIRECSKCCFMTPGKEIQLDAANQLKILLEDAAKIKQEILMDNDEDAANIMLCFEMIRDALIDELNMWIALKDDDPSDAWNYLIGAQMATRTAMQAHSMADDLENDVKRLHFLEHLLFPPQTFLSRGIIIDQADCKCSICGQIYGECNHIKGKAYMGQICTRLIEHVKEVKEFSIVNNPADKRCRIYLVGNKDTLSLRTVSRNANGDEGSNVSIKKC